MTHPTTPLPRALRIAAPRALALLASLATAATITTYTRSGFT